MAKLFGFSIEDTEPISPGVVSPVPPNNEDGVDHYLSSGFFGSYVDIEGVYKTEFDLIKRYREMSLILTIHQLRLNFPILMLVMVSKKEFVKNLNIF